jgi:hypothetical protein
MRQYGTHSHARVNLRVWTGFRTASLYALYALEKIMDYDFSIEDHGSIILLRPLSDAGREWIEEHVSTERQTFGDAIVVERRYITDLIEGISADGLLFTKKLRI